MSAAEDRARFARDLRTSVGGMFLTVVAYSAIVVWLWKVAPAAQNPTLNLLEVVFLVVANALLLAGFIYWRKLPTKKMKELPARKFGKAEREPGPTPRAIALRTQTFIVAAMLEAPAVLGLVLHAMGAPTSHSLTYIGASALGVLWLWIAIPAKAQEVLA
ncbi:MAG TPA: hypothetical protein V6D00_06150 [Pantanalinema sp.]